MNDKPATVYERVHAVLSAMPAIGKNGQAPGSMGGYNFRSIEDITAALKPLLSEHGVVIVPSIIDRCTETRSTSNNKALYVVDLLVRFSFRGIDGDEFTAEVWGEGTDSGDKATQKAITSAFKSMLSVTFCISDSEYDAERHDVPETQAPARVPKQRIDALVAEVKQAGLEGWVKDQGFGWPWTADACDAIEAKLGEPL